MDNRTMAYERAKKYLQNIASSPYYDIVEDNYDYDDGLLLIEYESEDALCGIVPNGELGHTCVNIDDFRKSP